MDGRLPAMLIMYRNGQTLAEIGAAYGLTRERVRQLLKKLGVARNDGGAHVRGAARLAAAVVGRDSAIQRRTGMTLAQWLAHTAVHGNVTTRGSPYKCFTQQRTNASARGIEWNISFADWWRVWETSGKWRKRGRGYGYCMARYRDTGAYTLGNVVLCTGAQNAADSYITKPAAGRMAKAARTRAARKALEARP